MSEVKSVRHYCIVSRPNDASQKQWVQVLQEMQIWKFS